MFGPSEGTWWVYSKKDPRWNREGRGDGFVTLGGPEDMQTWIRKCKEKFGDPPDDAEMGFMKD